MDIEKITAAYIALRDKRDAIGKEADEKRAALKVHMDVLEAAANVLLGSAQSIKTASGSAYRAKTLRARVTDRDAWFDYIRTTQHFEFLTTHVVTAEVQAYMEGASNASLPGLALSEVLSINFRRS